MHRQKKKKVFYDQRFCKINAWCCEESGEVADSADEDLS